MGGGEWTILIRWLYPVENTATSSTPGGLALQRRAHVLVYGLGVEGWVSVCLIVLLQWFLVDQGQWQGLPPGLQKIVYGVVIYSTLVDIAMSYSVDLLACAQALIRLYVTFGIVYLFPAVQSVQIVYPCMLVVWSLIKVVAYSYGAAHSWCLHAKDIPAALTNARFSWFRFLFPISVFLEVLMAYLAMPIAKEWNKTYSLVMVLGAFAYLPGM